MTKVRILIVEDEAIIATEIENQLQSLGYAVTSIVDTGEKAIQKAEEDKPDLILMDIRIKGEMDGIDTAEEIRSRFGIPVIFSTAYLDEERIDRAKITMPFGYVLKPIQERNLKVTIEMALYVANVDMERRKTEEALKKSEEFLNKTGEMARVGGWEVNLEKNTVYWSAVTKLIHEVPFDYEPTLNEAINFFPGESGQLITDAVNKAIEFGESYELELEFETAKKNRIMIQTIGHSKFENGKCLRLFGTFQDITQRMQTEEDLQEKEILLKAAGRLARVGGWSADLVKRKTIWSDEVAIIHGKKPGYSPSAEDNQKFIAPEWRERVQEAFAECIRDGSPLEEEMEIITEQGERLWIKTTGELVKNESGEIIGIQGALQDITATKHLGESLRQAQKMEAIGTLAGGIAHDFNNILSGILGYAQIATLHQLTKDHPAHKTVTNIISAADRAAELVKHILTFSRQRPSEKTKTQVVPIVKETLKLIKASIPSTIQITQNFSAEEDLVYADPSAIQQIIMNFSTNAVHAMRESGGNLFLHVEEAHIDEGDQSIKLDLKPGAYLAISVKDTGKGIPKVISDRIFEPYFTTKPVGEGTGLGLSVVHGIVKDLGGAVTVDSEPGKGSLFCAFIPRADSVLQTEKVADNQLHKGSGHILVVDDELIIAETAQDMLEELGYQVTIYTDSREALEVFLNQKDDIDLVLTDMTMPHIRGDQLARKILKIKPECPIILCTGFSELIDEKKAQEIGIRDFIMKPINWTDLTRKIRDALANPLSG